MIVYGDPSRSVSLSEFVAELRAAQASDDARAFLIRAGQLEQALADLGPAPEAEALTDAAAEAFLGDAPVGAAIDGLPFSDRPLTVKLPEGFAFYALYPESYVQSALRWREAMQPTEPVLVIGVRSIGTTLSAVVAAGLRRAGVAAHRLTVRPTGHPFDRQTSLDRASIEGVSWALVVDEGPGLSGSSMASVGEALVRVGFPRGRIAFLPGHGGMPGDQASEAVRDWWTTTPRFWTPTEDLRWGGRGVTEILAQGEPVEDLTGGRWRSFVFAREEDWPAVAFPFERWKIRAGSTFWKFAGFTAGGTTLGFLPSPWIEGEPLRIEDGTPAVIAEIGRHLAEVAGPPLSPEERNASIERLREMLTVNLREVGLASPALEFQIPETPSAGDYRLAPWEWRRLPDGSLAKAGRIAPTLDHTVVGRQSIAWDVAGAIVEWGLDEAAARPLLAAVPVEPSTLRFYRAAYAAFRMGQCAMFADGSEEGRRLAQAAEFYRRLIGGVVSGEVVSEPSTAKRL